MLLVAVGGVADALLLGVFAGTAAPPVWAAVVAAIVLVNLSAVVFSVWSPVETRLIANRLAALGVTQQQLRTGVYLGISDPARRDWTKTALEDDVGMIWIEPGRLTYMGDLDESASHLPTFQRSSALS